MERRLKSKIHGVTFSDGNEHRQENVKNLKFGQKLFAKREEDNPFDAYALKLYADEEHTLPLGYIERETARQIAEQAKFGWTYDFEVAAITGGGPGRSYGCNIDIIARKE